MKRVINIKTQAGETSTLLIGNFLNEIHSRLPAEKKVFVITDTNLFKHYGPILQPFHPIVIETGEENKTFATVEKITRELLRTGADRSSFILGFGGGLVCDVAGFTAATYMRGLPFGFVSTSLLSQVDASTGGKNGINFEGYKNIIGTFRQPSFVLCDPVTLKTLPEREFIQGFAEIIKVALIRNETLFEYLENNVEKALQKNPETLEHLIFESVNIKASIVNRDEKETGERKILNFGHSFGHAIEKITRAYTHGEAISIGMRLACQLSEEYGTLSSEETLRILRLLEAYQLPSKNPLCVPILVDAMKKDKKKEGDLLHFVLLRKIGKAFTQSLSLEEILQPLSS